MSDKYKKLIKLLGENRVLSNELLFKYSSLHIGGPADLFYKAKNKEELVRAVVSTKNLDLPYFILGGGTNLVISDLGFRGIVIKNETSKIRLVGVRGRKEKIQKVYLEAESGVGINRLVRFSLEQGLKGLEAFLGQPGTVGGGIFINAHNLKSGKFLGDSLVKAQLLTRDGKIKEVEREYFRFGYDESRIQKTGEVVLSVIFELEKASRNILWPKAQEAADYRRKTQPQGVFSSGCTFRNLKKSEAISLATPDYTTSAGYILERLGLKGKEVGKARFSREHANFIIHQGGAKASDVLELILLAKKLAKERLGIELKEEIVLVGEF